MAADIDALLGWLNPVSDDFFIRAAFLPSDAFMSEYTSKFDMLIDTKFAVFNQVKDTLEAVRQSLESHTTTWQGVKVDMSSYGLGEISIVNSEAIAYYGEKMRYWIAGLMYFLISMYAIRKVSTMIGSGK